jgi:hypothetical protein
MVISFYANYGCTTVNVIELDMGNESFVPAKEPTRL